MPLRSRLTTKVGSVFTKVTTKLEGASTVELLKASNEYDEFDTLLTLTQGFYFEYSENRKKVALEIGRNDTAMTEAMADATHLKLADVVWAINRSDTTSPSMADVTWKITADLFERVRERYTIV